jgi:hypothetical protein
MNKSDKEQFLNLIQLNIAKYGYHIATVSSVLEPRYSYTIGLKNKLGFELIFAGGLYYLQEDLSLIFETASNRLNENQNLISQQITVDTFGSFSFKPVDSSWSKLMILGVFDFYQTNDVKAFQIIPDPDHYTLDIPDMTKEFTASVESVWQWLVREWDYPVPKNSSVVTNLDALMGKAITEVMRCEDNEWEMFAGAGPDVQSEDMLVVSLATILGIDKTLLPAIDLGIGKGLWRETARTGWNNWG